MCNTWCFAEFTGASSVPSCVHNLFFTEKSRKFVKVWSLKNIATIRSENQWQLCFFCKMHRPDTSIRGAWNAAGDDSECYNGTGSPIFDFFKAISNLPLDNSRMKPPSANHNSNWGANCRVLCIHGLQPFLVWVYFPNMHIVNLGVLFKLDYYGCWQDEALDPQIILRWVALSDPKMVCHILICSTISSLASSQVRGPLCFWVLWFVVEAMMRW